MTAAIFLAIAATLAPPLAPPLAPLQEPAVQVTAKKTPAAIKVVPAPKPVVLAAKSDEVVTLVKAMQKTYEDTKNFTATFTQKYTNALFRRTTESKGRVQFMKPGLMRWDYKVPGEKAFVVDGKSLWIYDAAGKTAMVDRCFKQDGLTASVAFLWGSGDILKEFNVTRFGGVFGEKTDDHLELIPKAKNGVFAKLILVLDPKSHRVKQSIVVDHQGNVNQFMYDDLKFNAKLDKKTFAFKAPAGVHTAAIPGTCAKP